MKLAFPATLVLTATATSAQSFVQDGALLVGGVPFNNSYTENVDFGDVDLDGDWDVVMADGGDQGNDQNRIWINQGGLQAGVVGTFLDETATRAPVLSDDSRDVEFADLDNDDDLDVYVANTAQIVNQGARFWINQGGAQAGALGFYLDETASRWVGIGQPGSSIAPTLLIPNSTTPETFIDWSCDADFGDLDADGDLDLVHSSYGGAFGGQVPTRLFLNDGDGYFSEHNPPGYQLAGSNLPDGAPGLWCQGVQQANTTATDGSRCDITSDGEDTDVGDIDGDLDLEILQGGLSYDPRIFGNLLDETGELIFRDVTLLTFHPASFPDGHVQGNGHYEQEMGDVDGDDDLDILGINWSNTTFAYSDVVLENVGGTFANTLVLADSGSDDQEGDFIDYDNDGDLDVIVSNFSGENRLYRNDTAGLGLSFANVTGELPVVPVTVSWDIDVCDYDNDGDYDYLEGNTFNAANRFFRNTTEIPDTHAPRLAKLESVSGGTAGAGTQRVRVQVYDNAPYYATYANPTVLEVEIDGVALPDSRMRSSGGQIFRGELPANLVGDVTYRARSTDATGNSGVSSDESFTNTGATGTLSGVAASGPGGEPTLVSLTSPFAESPLHLVAGNTTPGAVGFWLVSVAGTTGGIDLGGGFVLNVAAPLAVPPILGISDSGGRLLLSVDEVPAALSGFALHAQALLADGTGGAFWSSTRALTLDFP